MPFTTYLCHSERFCAGGRSRTIFLCPDSNQNVLQVIEIHYCLKYSGSWIYSWGVKFL